MILQTGSQEAQCSGPFAGAIHLGSFPDQIKTYGGAHHLSFNLDRFTLRLLNGISALTSRPTSSLLREMRLGQFPSSRIFS